MANLVVVWLPEPQIDFLEDSEVGGGCWAGGDGLECWPANGPEVGWLDCDSRSGWGGLFIGNGGRCLRGPWFGIWWWSEELPPYGDWIYFDLFQVKTLDCPSFDNRPGTFWHKTILTELETDVLSLCRQHLKIVLKSVPAEKNILTVKKLFLWPREVFGICKNNLFE